MTQTTQSPPRHAPTRPEFTTLELSLVGDVLRVVIDNPASELNAVDDDLHSDLANLFTYLRVQREARAVLLTGRGRAFSAGGDFDWFEGLRTVEGIEPLRVDAARIIHDLLDVEVPIVVALNGHAIGLGASLALLSDVVLMADTATIADPHVRVGLVAGDGGVVVWPFALGPLAKYYLLTGDAVTAAEAERLGLILRAVPADELDAQAMDVANRLAAGAPLAVRYTKVAVNRLVKQMMNTSFAEAAANETVTFLSRDHREAVAAIKEARTRVRGSLTPDASGPDRRSVAVPRDHPEVLGDVCPLEAIRGLWEAPAGFDPTFWSKAADLGWTAGFVPEDLGGGSVSGRPVEDAALIAEEMGRQVAPGPFLATNVVASSVASASTIAEHASWLAALLAGTSVAAWAIQEPGATWDGAMCSVRTSAHLEGSDVIVSGTKSYVDSAGAADVMLVVARSDGGLSQVLIPTDTEGVTVTPGRSIDITRRFGSVSLNRVRLPLSAVVGEIGTADQAVERALQLGLVMQAAETVGAASRAFEMTVEYMSDRFAFGRPISSFQALKHRVADMRQWIEFAHGIVDAAASAVEERSPDAATLVSVAKAYTAERAIDIVDDCVQLSGGIGVTWEHDVHLFSRRVTLNRALLGTPEQHKERLCFLLTGPGGDHG